MKRLFLLLIPYLVFGYVENHDSMQTSFIKIYGAGPKGGSIKDTAFKNSRVKFDANGFMVRDTIPDSVRAAGKADLSKHADSSDGSARSVFADSSTNTHKADTSIKAQHAVQSDTVLHGPNEVPLADTSRVSGTASKSLDTIVDTGDVSTSGTNNPRAVTVIGLNHKLLPAYPIYSVDGYSTNWFLKYDQVAKTNNWFQSMRLDSLCGISGYNGSLFYLKYTGFTTSFMQFLTPNASTNNRKFIISPVYSVSAGYNNYKIPILDSIQNSDILFRVDSSGNSDSLGHQLPSYYLHSIAGLTADTVAHTPNKIKALDSVITPLVLGDSGKFWKGIWALKCSTNIAIIDSFATRTGHFTGVAHDVLKSDSIAVWLNGRPAIRTDAEILADIGALAVGGTAAAVTGLSVTAGKTLTVTDNATISGALGTGAYATIANYAPLASPTFTTQIYTPLVSGVGGVLQFTGDAGSHTFSLPPVGNNGGTWLHFLGVKSDGVSEIGRYIDFHETSNDGIDYSFRLSSNGHVMTCSGEVITIGALQIGNKGTPIDSLIMRDNVSGDTLYICIGAKKWAFVPVSDK